MKLEYDATTDSLYIHLNDRPAVDSDEIAQDVVIDFDDQGSIVGID